jgi:hypothetical protein
MAKSLSLSGFFEDSRYPKLVLAIGAIFLLVMQLGIFVAVYNQSGLKSRVCITDTDGRKIFESMGSALSSYERMLFENNYGPLRNYTTQIESELVPFNYRAWIMLAVGMPMGLILMLFFMTQVWLILLNGSPNEETSDEAGGKTRFSSFMSVSKNLSILGLGFVIVLSMLILWLIPSIIGEVARSFLNSVKDYPWFFMGVALFVGGLLVWVIYLRYKLSKQMLSNQMEIEKYRIKRQMLEQNPVPQLLAAPAETEETRTQFLQQGEH